MIIKNIFILIGIWLICLIIFKGYGVVGNRFGNRFGISGGYIVSGEVMILILGVLISFWPISGIVAILQERVENRENGKY